MGLSVFNHLPVLPFNVNFFKNHFSQLLVFLDDHLLQDTAYYFYQEFLKREEFMLLK